MKKEETGSAFAPATSYATDTERKLAAHCEMLAKNCEALERSYYAHLNEIEILRNEVERLNAALDFRGTCGTTYNKLCQAIVALPCCPLAGLIGEAAQELGACESHNDEAERTAIAVTARQPEV